jgi:hypothetical protein
MADESAPEESDPIALFSEAVRTPVEGLIYLGQLSEIIDFCGHTFGLRTLLPQDKFAISAVLQPYRNTIMEVDAFQAAHVAVALTEIDGNPDFCSPIGPGIESATKGRLNWVSQNLYPPTIEFLWNHYAFLTAKALQAMQELDRLSKGSQPSNLPPWLDSLTAQGTSPDATHLGIQPFTPSNFS